MSKKNSPSTQKDPIDSLISGSLSEESDDWEETYELQESDDEDIQQPQESTPLPQAPTPERERGSDGFKLTESALIPRFPRITMGQSRWETAVAFVNHFRNVDDQEETEETVEIAQAIRDNSSARNASELNEDFVRGMLIGWTIAEQEQRENV